MKASLLYSALWLSACAQLLADFPTQEEVQSRLAVGMTPEQVVALFGTPGTGTPEGPGDQRVFSYLCPVGRRTREVEGYVGFKVFFENDRLTTWRPIQAKPSYDPEMHAREHLLPVAWWWGLLLVGGVIYAIAKAFRRGQSEYERILEAYASRISEIRVPHFPMSLARFHEAQADMHAGYKTALREIRRGRKTSHWIWYIFPQLAGLGRSGMAEKYAIRDLAEACDYLRDPLLRARYEEITAAANDQLSRGRALEDLMGSRIDALKLVSSLTLFRAAAERMAKDVPAFNNSLATAIEPVLTRAAAHGYPACVDTLSSL